MITVVFAGHAARQPGEYDLGPGQPENTHHLLQHRTARPRGKRDQHVLTSSVASVEKPDIRDAQKGHRAEAFNFAHQAQRPRVLTTFGVRPRISASAINDSDAFVLVKT